MDTIYTLPGLLLSVTFVVGRGILNAAIAISIATSPQYYRVVRNHTQSVKPNYLRPSNVHPPGQFSPATYFST